MSCILILPKRAIYQVKTEVQTPLPHNPHPTQIPPHPSGPAPRLPFPPIPPMLSSLRITEPLCREDHEVRTQRHAIFRGRMTRAARTSSGWKFVRTTASFSFRSCSLSLSSRNLNPRPQLPREFATVHDTMYC